MLTTDKDSCRIVVNLLRQHGVRHAVVSPGSRNAPIIVALARESSIEKHIVIDERSAGFIALGIAENSRETVALVCTSGTALLNYAPAVAEAYYQNLPLIVISADRPLEWIDQDDSQTLRQPGALTNIVKRTYALKAECDNSTARWWINREVNDAMATAKAVPQGPVHINMSINEPLNGIRDYNEHKERFVEVLTPRNDFSVSQIRWIATELASPRKVLIVGGFSHPDETLNRALIKIAKSPNVAILSENVANIRFPGLIDCIDSTLCVIPEDKINEMRPDVVLSFGGALVSRLVKRFLRESPNTEHWNIGPSDRTVDCFQSLTKRIEVEPPVFFCQLATAMRAHGKYSDYADKWQAIKKQALESHEAYLENAPWCDLTAFSQIYKQLPRGCNVQLSNGTAIRYSQLFTSRNVSRYNCNRGVSGIEGSTSTAIGASIEHDGLTILITGDMGAQYDLGALASQQLSPKVKIVVMCNGGGAIFRFIPSTSSLPELNDYFACSVNLPLKELCQGFDIAYFEAVGPAELERNFPKFLSEKDRPSLLAIYTDGLLSADVLRGYFNRKDFTTLKPK